jgi:hypothetical protein
MSYTKPQIIKLDDAVKAIQGDEKGSNHLDNVQGQPPIATASAYQADE